jgi:microcystin-dependent protein
MEGFMGQIRMFAGNFTPRFWAVCYGQLLSISQNQALFSILGTTYGGNGTTTFALPDLRGKTPVGWGQGSGLTPYTLGEVTGFASTTLTGNNLPPHNHAVSGTIKMATTNQPADTESPAGAYFANDGSNKFDGENDKVTMQPATLNLTVNNPGSVVAVNNMMPYLAMNYVICLQGIFPSRN